MHLYTSDDTGRQIYLKNRIGYISVSDLSSLQAATARIIRRNH